MTDARNPWLEFLARMRDRTNAANKQTAANNAHRERPGKLIATMDPKTGETTRHD